jgi:hypothetical protein
MKGMHDTLHRSLHLDTIPHAMALFVWSSIIFARRLQAESATLHFGELILLFMLVLLEAAAPSWMIQ